MLASAEYHRLAEMEDISGAALPYQPINQERLRAFFGEKLYPVAKRENEKECLAAVTVDTLVRTWPEIRQIISEIPMPEAVDGLLKQIGAKHCLPDIGVRRKSGGAAGLVATDSEPPDTDAYTAHDPPLRRSIEPYNHAAQGGTFGG